MTELPTDIPEPAAPPRKTPQAPPQRSRSAKRTAPAGKSRPVAAASGRKEAYKEGLNGILQLSAGVALPFVPADSAAILAHGDNVSEALADLGTTDERIGALLDKIVQVGPYGAVIAAIAPMIAQIAVNHGALPAGILGTVHPVELVAGILGPDHVKVVKEDDGAETARDETASNNVHA